MITATHSAGVALALMFAGSAAAQTDVRFHSRMLVQEITGAGAGRTVTTLSDGATTPDVQQGARLRYTLQFRLEDLNPTSPDGAISGLASSVFYIRQTAGGLGSGQTARSFLTTGAGGVGVNEDATQSQPGAYPSAGTSTSRSGFHRWVRSGAGTTDTSVNNGVFGGLEPMGVNALGNLVPLTAIAGISNPGQTFSDPSVWYGIYSFEFEISPFYAGPLEYAFRPSGSTDGPSGTTLFQYWRDAFSLPASVTSANGEFAPLGAVRVNVVPTPAGGLTLLSLSQIAFRRRR